MNVTGHQHSLEFGARGGANRGLLGRMSREDCGYDGTQTLMALDALIGSFGARPHVVDVGV